MALGRNRGEREQDLWLSAEDLPTSPGHPFYEKLQEILQEAGFDAFCEEACASFYSDHGRPSIPPGTYFRMLMIGFFEGIDSERGIAWRCTDSLSLRSFLLLGPADRVPDHSSLCRIRQRIDVETHQKIFDWVLERLLERGLLKGRNLGIDATTMEANAAMRSIVRKDTGQTYDEFLGDLAEASGIETPTRRDLKRLDRKRKKKGSNSDWENPNDPDAKITKLKDGRTKLAYKPEHTVDLDSEAVISAEVHTAERGDTRTGMETLAEACETLTSLGFEPQGPKNVVADMGYHSNEVLGDLADSEIRTYISEPERGRRNWRGRTAEEHAQKIRDQRAVYANRRRLKGNRGRRLTRKRQEVVERIFAHVLDSGGMRRAFLRGLENVKKRYLVQVAAYNLSLILRATIGAGKPRAWAAKAGRALADAMTAVWRLIRSRDLGQRLEHRLGSAGVEERLETRQPHRLAAFAA